MLDQKLREAVARAESEVMTVLFATALAVQHGRQGYAQTTKQLHLLQRLQKLDPTCQTVFRASFVETSGDGAGLLFPLCWF